MDGVVGLVGVVEWCVFVVVLDFVVEVVDELVCFVVVNCVCIE